MQFSPSLSREETRKIVDESCLALERWERRIEREDLMKKRQQKGESYSPGKLATSGNTMEILRQETLQHQENNDDEKKKVFEGLYLRRKIPFFSAYYKWKPADNYSLDNYMEYLNTSSRSTPLFLSIPFASTRVLTSNVSVG